MAEAEMNEKGSKSIIARDFVFKSKMHVLAAGLRPDPLGELERSPKTP